MTLALIGKGLVLGGLAFKHRGHVGSRCIQIYIYTHFFLFDRLRISLCSPQKKVQFHACKVVKYHKDRRGKTPSEKQELDCWI